MKTLLLLLSHYPFDEKNRERLAELLSDVTNWTEVVNLINSHGIIALAAYNIKEAHLENLVPEEYVLFLENGLRQNIVRNLWLTERWKEVNSILTAAGIKHILLKGMALEHTVYEARGLRQMNDTDIFVRKEEAVAAWHILRKNGFEHGIPKSSLHIRMMKDTGRHLPALYREGFALEIHTCLFGYPEKASENDESIFKNARTISISGVQALIPDKETHLSYLIDHFKRHLLSGESQLRTYSDIVMLSETQPFTFPDLFIQEPDQKAKPGFRRASYRSKLRFMKPKYRLLYLIGDLFPSLQWMKQRYRCGTFGAVLHYPHRLGKLGWLV